MTNKLFQIAAQQVKISRSKAIALKTGATSEMEELRVKLKEALDSKSSLESQLSSLNKRRDEEELKKIKSAEHIARWEESKKWKKSNEGLSLKVTQITEENERLQRALANLRTTLARLEKEKGVLEGKLAKGLRSTSASTTTTDSSSGNANILALGEIARLKIEVQDANELAERLEFEGKEEAERLKMEVKLLKERIVSQERQLVAYQVAQKGEPKVIAEIEGMAGREASLQKEIRRLEEDNLGLRLQMEQLRLDTPRLRDRVHHLQKYPTNKIQIHCHYPNFIQI